MNLLKKIYDAFHNKTLSYQLFKFFNRHRHLFVLTDPDLRNAQVNLLTYKKLKKKYSYVLEKPIQRKERICNKTIWVCWFQGIENAPKLCQVCVKRISQVFGKENVVIVTKENFKDYIRLPDHIIEKWEKGIITNTHFSDILRVALLSEKGGTWIDATILILKKDIPSYFYDSRLFMFADHISGICPNIQSSYMSAYSNSRLLIMARELIYEYWKNENYLLDYSLFHLFVQMAQEKYPEEWNEVYKYPNHSTHILRKSLFERFENRRFAQIIDVCPIQKLTYKKKIPQDIDGTFYDVLINKGEDFFKEGR